MATKPAADQVTVQVTIESASLSPEQISSEIGMGWDRATRIGDPRGRTGKQWECNAWQVRVHKNSSDNGGMSAHELLPLCIDELVERIRPYANGLRKVVSTEGGEFAMWVMSTSVPGISLNREIVAFIGELGLSLDIDIVLSAEEGHSPQNTQNVSALGHTKPSRWP